jgi:hypothetical protein
MISAFCDFLIHCSFAIPYGTLQIWFRRIFFVFVSVFVARLLLIAFLLNQTLVLNSPEWLIHFFVEAISILQFCFFGSYIVYAVVSIIVAKALSKNLIFIVLYFVCLAVILFYIATKGGILIGILGNALLGTTLTTYWLLSRELQNDEHELSLLRRED